MIYTQETLNQVKTASDVKYALQDSYFFSRDTMRFFGDKMSSFGVRTIKGKRYLIRKPNAYVNVFGTRKQAGRDFFGAWELIPKHDHIDLRVLSSEEKTEIYNSL